MFYHLFFKNAFEIIVYILKYVKLVCLLQDIFLSFLSLTMFPVVSNKNSNSNLLKQWGG